MWTLMCGMHEFTRRVLYTHIAFKAMKQQRKMKLASQRPQSTWVLAKISLYLRVLYLYTGSPLRKGSLNQPLP